MASPVTGSAKTLLSASMPEEDQAKVTVPKEKELTVEQIAANKAKKRADELNERLTQLTARKTSNQEAMNKVDARIEALNSNYQARSKAATKEKTDLEAQAKGLNKELETVKKELRILNDKYPTLTSYLWSFVGY